jgi:hypothetical protein
MFFTPGGSRNMMEAWGSNAASKLVVLVLGADRITSFSLIKTII